MEISAGLTTFPWGSVPVGGAGGDRLPRSLPVTMSGKLVRALNTRWRVEQLVGLTEAPPVSPPVPHSSHPGGGGFS